MKETNIDTTIIKVTFMSKLYARIFLFMNLTKSVKHNVKTSINK